MKIQAVEAKKLKPLTNTTIQIQIRGKNSGYLTCTTDAKGYFQLDNKYKGQQIAHYMQSGSSGQWLSAADNTTLYIDTSKQPTYGKEKQTTQSYK
jgi:hypothetical protein